MALINCSECKTEVSDKASACPTCGNPINTPAQELKVSTTENSAWTRNRGFGDILIYGVLIVILVAVFAG